MAWLSRSHVLRIAIDPRHSGHHYLCVWWEIFIHGARHELSGHKPGMMTLISLGIVVAFAASLASTLGLFEVDVWWELSTLVSVMLLGHWLEMKAVSQARGALDALAALLPDTAERVTQFDIEKVPLAAWRVGDVVIVRPGSRVPADGTVLGGTADVE
jgi:Cu2+-exporting ATPase